MVTLIKRGLAAALLLAAIAGPSPAECQELPAKLEQAIAQFVSQVRGAEYPEYRRVAQGNLGSGDNSRDVAVVFHVEGSCDDDKASPPGSCGNHVDHYLAVYLDREQVVLPLLRLLSPNEATVQQMRIEKGKIIDDVLGPRAQVQSGHLRRPQAIYFVHAGKVIRESDGQH